MTVQRIYPEAKTALINWIEESFHEIDSYIFIAKLKDGTTMTLYHIDSHLEGVGLCELAKAHINEQAMMGQLLLKR
jgi:hypothetical protein